MHCKRLLIGLLALLPVAAQGSAYQSLASIRQAAENFVLSHAHASGDGSIEVAIGELDRRLRLPLCGQPLQAFLPPGGRLQGNTTIGVSCPDARPWKLYVPTRIRHIDRVIVARYHLPRGTRIQAGDLAYEERDLAVLNRGYFTEQERLVGKVLNQPVAAGKVISPYIIKNPRLVKRGQGVTILAVSGSFEIRMKGKALMDGSAGDYIKVRNIKSQRIVEGEVIGAGLIKVPL